MRATALALAYAALLLVTRSSFCAAAPKVTIRIVPRSVPEENVAPVGPVPFREPMVYYQGTLWCSPYLHITLTTSR